MSSTAIAPIALGVNAPEHRPYRGGLGISRFRGIGPLTEHSPEDFVASSTEVFSGEGVGLTTLDDGRPLRDAIAADPLAWLGPEQVAAHGESPALLVKLLDTRERLFTHFHPDDAFARDVLHRPFGKTEAWAIIATDGPATAYLGFSRQVSESEVLGWFATQDREAMLAAMNGIRVAPGDTLFVPAGLPHAIGEGITLVELQQPVDLSIILEWQAYPGLDASSAVLGLDPGAALSGLDRSAWDADRLRELRSSRAADDTTRLFPQRADAFFRADLHTGAVRWDADFAVLVVLDGTGSLRWNDGELELAAGTTVLVPWGAGSTWAEGDASILRCRPPAQ
jgi:mannose-6-phosphate isomerase